MPSGDRIFTCIDPRIRYYVYNFRKIFVAWEFSFRYMSKARTKDSISSKENFATLEGVRKETMGRSDSRILHASVHHFQGQLIVLQIKYVLAHGVPGVNALCEKDSGKEDGPSSGEARNR